MTESSAVACLRLSHRSDDYGPAPSEAFQLDELPARLVSIRVLILDDLLRQGGENDDHVRVLAELDGLPPIVVHGQSMRVIDGAHRVRAALLRGEDTIEAKIYSGSDADAFVLAVRMNIAHGLPLTRADRTAAAARIIESHPQWSNRMIAGASGLAAATVRGVRRRSTGQNAQSTIRVGKDGRVRPTDGTAGRLKAGELLAERPTASIREIAKAAGVSPSTVHDVRQRLLAGQNPLLERQVAQQTTGGGGAVRQLPTTRNRNGSAPADDIDTAGILAVLRKDPSLRFSEAGRALIRWLEGHRAGMARQGEIAELVPDHCTATVAKLARGYGCAWIEFAAQLEERWDLQASG